MRRYMPSEQEIAELTARGWNCDSEGWWWPNQWWENDAYSSVGRTYKEALRAANQYEANERMKATRGKVQA